jgi:hypothetical protein
MIVMYAHFKACVMVHMLEARGHEVRLLLGSQSLDERPRHALSTVVPDVTTRSLFWPGGDSRASRKVLFLATHVDAPGPELLEMLCAFEACRDPQVQDSTATCILEFT